MQRYSIGAGLPALLLALIVPGCASIEPTGSPAPPNVVLIFADDLGFADLGCFGATGHDTPHLDRLAAEGMRFTDFAVSQAVCSASRAALLTGCYSNRVSILGALGPNARHGIHDDEWTIAEMLGAEGYATCAVGKWHLGHHEQFLPLRHGFDEYLGIPYSNDMWPVHYDGTPLTKEEPGPKPWRAEYPLLPLVEGAQVAQYIRTLDDQDTLTRRYTERAVDFIERSADGPFFLYLAHSMPHVPLGNDPRFDGVSATPYGDVISEIDWSVGAVLDALRRVGAAENTIVIFTSDNGPWLNYGNHAGAVGPLREGKGTSWEGGVRVPCIVRWPGVVTPGSVCDELASTIDVLPTLAAACDASVPGHPIDGVDLGPLLRGSLAAPPRDELVLFYGKQLQALRAGRWKLHVPHGYRSYEGVAVGNDGFPGPYAQGETGTELYDLAADVGERYDVASDHPDVVASMLDRVEVWRRELGDGDAIGRGVRPAGRLASDQDEQGR